MTISDEVVTIEHVRDFVYEDTETYTPQYITRTVPLDSLVSVDYLVEPFGERPGVAHTLLTFGYDTASGTEYIAVSIEIRKEKGESFSALKGLFREYELMYVIGTEQDLIGLRTNHRNDDVYLYPIRTTKEKVKELFLELMVRTQQIEAQPEFYNTLTNNCTGNLRHHVNNISPKRVPWSIYALLPEHSDRFLYDLDLIDTSMSFDEAKDHFYITDIAQEAGISTSFSQDIRSAR